MAYHLSVQSRSRRRNVNGCTWLIVAVLGLTAVMLPGRTCAETIKRIPAMSGDRLGGLVLPVEPRDGPIQINAMRAWTWTIEETKRLVLSGDIEIHIADFSFEGKQRSSGWIEFQARTGSSTRSSSSSLK